MNNSLVGLLIKLKNAALVQKELVEVPYNNLSIKLLELLYQEGLIQTYKVNDKHIKILIRYYFGKSVLKNLKLISKPSNLKYFQLKDLYKTTEKKKVLVLSTSKGFLTGFNCKQKKIGGKILFIC